MCVTDIPAVRLVVAARAAPAPHALTASPKERLAVFAMIVAEPIDPLRVSVPDSGPPAIRVYSPAPSSL